ncbi:hypothetical protein VNO78_11415 [Psophocarpus tetragonolobus]|uniref:Uncharacterized protein n=1 Tax=Psophocarpus tetragonolobus TaxID=3891 RepID=A0AAN9SNY3_PSOTE
MEGWNRTGYGRETNDNSKERDEKRSSKRKKAERAALLEKVNVYNYPLEEYNKVLDMEKFQYTEEDEEEPEVEYVEGYDELEEEET